MTAWEKRIVGVFAERYPVSAAASIVAPDAASGKTGEDDREVSDRKLRLLRLRPDRVFPGFEQASPDERESFLEAAESLERRGVLSLVWARHRKGEAIRSLTCRNPELLFELAGKPSPRTVAEAVREAARPFAAGNALFSFLTENFTPQDAAAGIDVTAVTDLARLSGFFSGEGVPALSRPDGIRGITPRALSVALYRDSKRLETVIDLFAPLLNRARRLGVAVPDFAFLDRAVPETYIAGKVVLCFDEYNARNAPPETAPLVNATGSILALPLGTILKLRAIAPVEEKATPSVLMIENKETFFALSESLPDYTCFLYTGGHPNRAVQALAALLARSGFTFSHAGDLDPDGILIMQELGNITGKRVTPVGMDAATFDRYRDCGRKLEPTMLRRIRLITPETRSLPGVQELIQRIEAVGVGVEQEIIDYR
jgi:hypothetical protein